MRKCTVTPTVASRRMLATKALNQPCDLGMLYDNNLNCTAPCSRFMDGCALCSSNTQCNLCSDASLTPKTMFTASGSTYSVCVATKEVCSDCQETCTATNCAFCSTIDDSQCIACNQGYVLQGTTCVQPSTTDVLSLTYFV